MVFKKSGLGLEKVVLLHRWGKGVAENVKIPSYREGGRDLKLLK